MDESDWLSAHVFYHDDLDRLLIEAVGPLTEELAGAGLADGCFFLRYWDGGPHVRVRVRPAAGRRAEVGELVTERLGRFVRDHPAPDRLRQAEYARLAGDLARWEGLATHVERLYPNNSVIFLPYRREHDRYGVGASIEAVERHFVDSSGIALRVLPVVPRNQRAVTACAMILLGWFVAEPDSARLAEWISRSSDSHEYPPGFDPASFDLTFRRQADQWVDLARRMRTLAGAASAVTGTGALVEWARSMAVLGRTLAAQIRAGAFTPPQRGWEGPDAIAVPGRPDTPLPTLDICAHLICNRLGVGLELEARARHCAARAVTVLAGDRSAPVMA
jgi:hypothetical protein